MACEKEDESAGQYIVAGNDPFSMLIDPKNNKEQGMRLLPPLPVEPLRDSLLLEKPGRRLPGRHHVLSVISTLLCSALLLASVVGLMDAGAQSSDVVVEHVPSVLSLISSSHRTTAARFDFSLAAQDPVAIDPLFRAYYVSHAGSSTLGAPLTPAYRLDQGVTQFFMSGALFLPGVETPVHSGSNSSSTSVHWESSHFGDLSRPVFHDGVSDPATGVIQLPLLEALLLDGSTLPIDDDSSRLTYERLRTAVGINTLVRRPSPAAGSGAFVPLGSIGDTEVGHTIQKALWDYISRPDISPDGWTTDVGVPLSEPEPFTEIQGDILHHMEVQVFLHSILEIDLNAQTGAGTPLIRRLDTGLAYLETLGAPAPRVSSAVTIWGESPSGDTPVLSAPGTGTTLAQIGLNFPLTFDGAYQWIKGTLWYKVSWIDGQSSGAGWISADLTTIASPVPYSPIWSSFASLSSSLESFLAGHGGHVGAAIFDVTRNRYYVYNESKQFYMASSVKVPIMLTLLTQLEAAGREPDDEEMSLLMTMIENSNNDSAQALFDEIGGAPALDRFMRSIGIADFSAFAAGWGYSTISPLAMVNLLTLLHAGKILTSGDRQVAINLMENIESDEQVGAGDTAPTGATVAMKDGWVLAPDYLWVMNSSGIITWKDETYIISVYSQEDSTQDAGWQLAEQVCQAAGTALFAS
jgi:Beta-lactamase enzyme family